MGVYFERAFRMRSLWTAQLDGSAGRVFPVDAKAGLAESSGPFLLRARALFVIMSNSVVTTTTVPSSGDGFLNAGYTWTIPGMLKLGQLVSALHPDTAGGGGGPDPRRYR